MAARLDIGRPAVARLETGNVGWCSPAAAGLTAGIFGWFSPGAAAIFGTESCGWVNEDTDRPKIIYISIS